MLVSSATMQALQQQAGSYARRQIVAHLAVGCAWAGLPFPIGSNIFPIL